MFEPPAPFEKSDTYPWRFGRRLSLIRRPLIVRPAPGGGEVVYGLRMLDSTGRWLVNELTGGRLKVSSKSMQQAMTAVAQRRDEAFNDAAGRMYESVDGRRECWHGEGVPVGPDRALSPRAGRSQLDRCCFRLADARGENPRIKLGPSRGPCRLVGRRRPAHEEVQRVL